MLLNVRKISLLATIFAFSALAQSENWQPVSAESLVELPANLIEKRIQQDFSLSPMANELLNLEQDLAGMSSQIQAVQTLIQTAGNAPMIDERVDLVKLKSSFLDLLQNSQTLRQQQLESKIEVYQNVLDKLYQQHNQAQRSETFELSLSQEKAKARMQMMMDRVDETILQSSLDEQSPYAKEFASNLNKIKQLKDAIASHQANLSATVDGVQVSTQEYIRQLLMQSSSERSLLDQESLMLSYMAKVVALDAQSLEFEISEMQALAGEVKVSTTPANAVALFL